MNARDTPRTCETARSTSLTVDRSVAGSSPKTLITIWPSVCEMLSSTLSRIGCEIAGSRPGISLMASSIWADSSSRVIFLVHSEGGFKSTKNSHMLIGFGSVPSSGRPACEITWVTSGNRRSTVRTRATMRDACDTETLGGSVRFSQSVPSFNSGRNSVPSFGTSSSAAISAAAALPTTSSGRRSARVRTPRYRRVRLSTSRLRSCATPRPSRNRHSNGTSVREKISEPTSADVTVYAIGAKIRPSCRCNVKIGMCATMMMSIENSVGRPTCVVASRIACRTDSRSRDVP